MADFEEFAGGRGAPRIKRDSFVSRVVGDARKPASAAVLTGYTGEAAEESAIRVYFDASLSSFADIEAEDIVAHKEVPEAVDPLGATILWLKPEARLKYGGSALGPIADSAVTATVTQPPPTETATFPTTASLSNQGATPGVPVGPHLAQLAVFFPGYSVTALGALVGAAYAAAVGGVWGALLATVWNAAHSLFLAVTRMRATLASYSID